MKPWIEARHDFVFKEDEDLGHKPGKSNTVRIWKQEHDLEFYFNYHISPDLAPIKNCWQLIKGSLRKFLH